MTEFTTNNNVAAGEMPLPDPRDALTLVGRGAFLVADEAARHARRLLDASRSILTGNFAMFCCLPATLLFWWDVGPKGDWARIVGSLVMIAFAVWATVSSLRLARLRSSNKVKITDFFEANLGAIRQHPFRRLIPFFVFVFGIGLAWSYLFKVIPGTGVAIAMWMVALVLAGVFVARFTRFHFWEDLLFAASIAAAWSLYLLQAWRVAPLAIVPPLAIIVGAVCLHQRWHNWVGALPAAEITATSPEVC